MRHETKIVIGGASNPWRPVMDIFCTCGEFWINVERGATKLAESHERVQNAKEVTCE
jgi:hypothetical protein